MKIILTLTAIILGYCQLTGQNELEQVRYLYKLNINDINSKAIAPNFTLKEINEWNNIKDFINDPILYATNSKPSLDIKIVAKILASTSTGTSNENYVGALGDEIKNAVGGNLGAQFSAQLIVAMSDIIIERAKAELTLQYFTKLKGLFLQSQTIIIPKASGPITITFTLKELFPNSYNALEALLVDNNVSITIIGQSFKGAFENDIKEFFNNASNKFIRGPFNSEPYYKYLEAVIYTVDELLKGSHPSLILQNLAYKNPITVTDNFNLGINLLNIISESLKNTTGNTIWVGQDAVDGLSAKEFVMYFSLLYINNKTFFTQLGIQPSQIATAREKYYPIIKQIAAYANITQGLLQQLNGSTAFSTNAKGDKTKQFFDYAHQTIDLFFTSENLLCQSMPGACNTVTDAQQLALHKIIDISQSVQQKDYSSVFRQTIQLIEELSTNVSLPPMLTKIAFMASDIASADSVEQIKNILDGAILPVGSFRIKRESQFTVHINAYPGMSAGVEFLDVKNVKNKGAAHFSPFVPVGFDMSWGKEGKKKPGRKSNGIFISIVDLGAVASYRIQNEGADDNKANELPDIKWRQIISPGIFYVHGFKNTPLSWGLGGNLSPSLREITDSNNIKLNNANAFKISAFIAIDIPLFNLSNR